MPHEFGTQGPQPEPRLGQINQFSHPEVGLPECGFLTCATGCHTEGSTSGNLKPQSTASIAQNRDREAF